MQAVVAGTDTRPEPAEPKLELEDETPAERPPEHVCNSTTERAAKEHDGSKICNTQIPSKEGYDGLW